MTPARTPEELDHIPRSASVYDTAPPAIAVLSKALACDQVQALEVLRAIIEAGYFIGRCPIPLSLDIGTTDIDVPLEKWGFQLSD